MTLSDQDKQRILEEEKERLKVRQQLQSEQSTKPLIPKKKIPKWLPIGCGGLFVLVIIIIIIAAISGGGNNSSNNPSTTLNAQVRYVGGLIYIGNNDDFSWTDVKCELNSGLISSGYTYSINTLEAHSNQSISLSQFTKSDGTRFDILSTKPLNIYIHANEGSFSGDFK